MAIAASYLLDLYPLQGLDWLRSEHVAGVAMAEPPEVSPAPAVHLLLVLGVGGGVVGAADDRRDPRRGGVEAAQHRRHQPVLRVPVPELPVLPSPPRAQHIAREERDGVAGAGGDEHHGWRWVLPAGRRARVVGGGHDRVHASITPGRSGGTSKITAQPSSNRAGEGDPNILR